VSNLEISDEFSGSRLYIPLLKMEEGDDFGCENIRMGVSGGVRGPFIRSKRALDVVLAILVSLAGDLR
jgi:hypothetical protein